MRKSLLEGSVTFDFYVAEGNINPLYFAGIDRAHNAVVYLYVVQGHWSIMQNGLSYRIPGCDTVHSCNRFDLIGIKIHLLLNGNVPKAKSLLDFKVAIHAQWAISHRKDRRLPTLRAGDHNPEI
jgi:hypothetical protein